ncbi:hypothetical protein ACQ4PT_005709 [Festuca glaucescens]
MSDLIPGLPEEVARECLIRVGFDQLPAVRRISPQWKEEVESPDYGRLRRAEGLACPVIAMVQAQPEHVEPGPAQKHSSASAAAIGGPANNYRMVLLVLAPGGFPARRAACLCSARLSRWSTRRAWEQTS